jgi:tRNA uridine 5-carboxymethylaminomethyl modification enzyme
LLFQTGQLVCRYVEASGANAAKPSRQSFTLEELLRRPQVDYAMLERFGQGGGLGRWAAEAAVVGFDTTFHHNVIL